MYRKKIMVIATIFVIGLLAVMISSSNIVAEHNKTTKVENKVQDTDDDLLKGDFAKEHLQDDNLNQEDSASEDNNSIANGLQRPTTGMSEEVLPLRLDDVELQPQIVERNKSKKTVIGNYVALMSGTNRLVLWNEQTFPLKVYLKDEANMPEGFADGIKMSFDNWKKATQGFITFEFVAAPDTADITVELTDSTTGDCSSEGGNSYGFNISGNILKSAYLKVSKMDCDKNPMRASNLYLTLQHNIGHILGLQVHSERYADAMYATLSSDNMNVTSFDASTLKYLYNFIPNVTNKPYTRAELAKKRRLSEIKNMSQDEVDEFLNKIIPEAGNTESKSDKLLADALDYYNNEEYEKAINTYKSALNVINKSMDRAYAYRNIAISYLDLEDYYKAVSFAELAYKETREPANEYLLAYSYYMYDEEQLALEHLEKLINAYPRLRLSYILAAKIYDSNKDYQKLQEVSDKARNTFPDNPPVVYTPLQST